MMEPALKQNLSGWGRYPASEGHLYRPEKRRAVAGILSAREHSRYIARGMGRSYGDTAISEAGGVISCLRLDRFLDFDESTGILHCESGVRFDTIIDTFLPKGYFIPVTPGTKLITVGGAIANDVHGKNHHRDGSFGHSLVEIELLLPSGEVMMCSREQNGDVFWATVGGIGLTGIVLTARFKLQRVESSWVVVDYLKTRDLDEVLDALVESDAAYQYSMAAVDSSAKGHRLGRAVLMRGNHAAPADLRLRAGDPLAIPRRSTKTLPIDFPQFVLNPWSIKLFNSAYYNLSPGRQGQITGYDPYFFPLDSIHHWNRAYGKRGFVQYQVTVPMTERQALVKIIELAQRRGRTSAVSVLKRFGPGNEGLLSHPFEGFTFTLDFAVNGELTAFLHELDEITLVHGGRLYLAKDAAMTPQTFRTTYPNAKAFEEIRARLDPEGILQSDLARRLGLANGSR